MRFYRRFVLIGVNFFAFLAAVQPVAGQKHTASATVDLPPTGEIASAIDPPCTDGTPNSTTELIHGMGATIDAFAIGTPIVSGVLNTPGVTERVKVIFGVHNGRANCQAMCVVVPAKARIIKEDACVIDREGNKCALVKGHNDILIDRWGGVRAFGQKVHRNKKYVCALGKGWSHDRAQTISWRVWY